MEPRTKTKDATRCALCKTAVVQMHCGTCLINLCKACVGEHSMSDEASKKHEIVQFKHRKSTLPYPRCTSHDKERCEMFCNHCNVPICSVCISSESHSSHKICEIMTLYSSMKKEIARENEEMQMSIYPVYENTAYDVQNRMNQLEKEYGDLSAAITKHGEEWHGIINKIVQNLKAEVDTMKSRHYDILKKNLAEINQRVSELEEAIQTSKMTMESNDIAPLLQFNRKILEFRKLPTKLEVSSPKFTPIRCQQEEFVKQFGKLSTLSLFSDDDCCSGKKVQESEEVGPPVKQLLKKPKVVSTIRTGNSGSVYDNLFDVACLSDEEIWTCGLVNNIELFSISQGTLLKTIKTKTGNIPGNIAVTNRGHLVYIDPTDRSVNIVKDGEIETVIKLQNWKPSNVCSTSSGDLLVTMDSDDNKQAKVVRYSGSNEKQTIQFDDKGQPLYSSGKSKCISENRNLNICVADVRANAVVVVNQAGKLRFRYTGHTPAPKNEPFGPHGISTDSQSHILTADMNNNCVHIIDHNGQFLAFIDCELSGPWGLCTDTNDNLFVGQLLKNHVKKIHYQV
ncbi:uncharacterized protein LOC134280007 [Saccostrea cucullata]|uniref:uncharacterized protein LOC134280007 n=1 Tax=Saccostrea cuccullata TaxID=36930 RepID=UPI002ED190C3